MNEFELIARLTRELPSNGSVITGAGDDCAVLDACAPDQLLLFKTDAVVAGVHFAADAPPEKVGRKALARCLSDIAAMAGTPTAALVTIGLPGDFDPSRVEAVYAGMSQLARQHGVAIVGGETTANPGGLFISVAVIGTVTRGNVALRSGAKPGDALFVTGELGGSLAGKHLDFEPRLVEARWLAGHFPIHAMIDISDGLAGDLPHLLRASHVGAELLKEAIPISPAAKRIGALQASALKSAAGLPPGPGGARQANTSPFQAALMDGEDFELLFTLAGNQAVPLLDAWKRQFPNLRLSCIGKIVAEAGVKIRDRRGVQPLTGHGYVHFS